MSSNKPKVLSSEIAHQNPWYRIRHDKLIWPNGKPGEYYVSEFPGAACLVCVHKDRLLTVTQYRYTIDRQLIELPIGRLEPNELPENAAKRELLEETGYETKTIHFLGQLWSLKGACRMAMYVFAAQINENAHAPKLDDAETGLQANWMSIKDWRQAIRDGKVADSESIAAWTLYTEWLATQNQS